MLLLIFIFRFFALIDAGPPEPLPEIMQELACGNCHFGINASDRILNKAPDLTLTGVRYKADFIFNYLLNPSKLRSNIGLMRMPDFDLSDKEAAALTLYLVSLVPDSLKQTATEYTESLQKIKMVNKNIDSEAGKKVFAALNCIACHNPGNTLLQIKNAPDLSSEGSRVKKAWLDTYLKEPSALRPFGYIPGSGSRMPDFRLTQDEISTISDFLIRQKKSFSTRPEYKISELSSFSKTKAEKLISEKLPCLGCHEFKGKGGKIAPSLSAVKERLNPAYVYEIVANPKYIAGDLIMPGTKMTPQTLKLISDYLNQVNNPFPPKKWLSPIDNKTIQYSGKSGAEKNYLKYCASCHGTHGDADGFNKQFLPVSPTHFSNAEYLAKRPDDTLFDGIFAGGYILNKSHLMPSWGFTLEKKEIKELVKYLRVLCACQPPGWSSDN